jgi:Afadin- and alpha -actinin-Binding
MSDPFAAYLNADHADHDEVEEHDDAHAADAADTIEVDDIEHDDDNHDDIDVKVKENNDDNVESNGVLSTSANVSTVINVSNYPSWVEYLNNVLPTCGFESSVQVDDLDANGKVRLISTLTDITREYQALSAYRQEAQITTQSLTAQLESQASRLAALRQDLESEKRSKWELEMRRRQEETTHSKAEAKFRIDFGALKKRFTVLRGKHSQYQHEIRKHEKEYSRLQDRLKTLLGKPSSGSVLSGGKSHCVMMNNPRSSSARRRTADNKVEEDMYSEMMSAYEQRLSVLKAENVELRESLRTVSTQVEEVLKSHGGVIVECNDELADEVQAITIQVAPQLKDALDDFTDGQFDMPLDMVRGNIKEGLETKLKLLQAKLERMKQVQEDSHNVDSLRLRVHELESIIEEQDAIIQAALLASGGAAVANPDTSGLIKESRRWSTLEDIKEERALATKEEQRLKTLAADLEARERAFEAERAKFEEDVKQAVSDSALPDMPSPLPATPAADKPKRRDAVAEAAAAAAVAAELGSDDESVTSTSSSSASSTKKKKTRKPSGMLRTPSKLNFDDM